MKCCTYLNNMIWVCFLFVLSFGVVKMSDVVSNLWREIYCVVDNISCQGCLSFGVFLFWFAFVSCFIWFLVCWVLKEL